MTLSGHFPQINFTCQSGKQRKKSTSLLLHQSPRKEVETMNASISSFSLYQAKTSEFWSVKRWLTQTKFLVAFLCMLLWFCWTTFLKIAVEYRYFHNPSFFFYFATDVLSIWVGQYQSLPFYNAVLYFTYDCKLFLQFAFLYCLENLLQSQFRLLLNAQWFLLCLEH